jgi:hypothetical protein
LNPYISVLDKAVEQLIKVEDFFPYIRERQKDEFVYWKKENEWVYPFTANYLVGLSYAYSEKTSKWFDNNEILSQVEGELSRLIDAAVDDRWYHLEQGMGDRNIDRFTALPVFDILDLLGEKMSTDLREKTFAKLDAVLQVQLKEFGEKGRIYPNMDIYYCFLMWHGNRLFNRKEYEEEYLTYLERIEGAQFEDGGWTYIKGTTECIQYHDLNVSAIGHLARIGNNERAAAMIEKSVPYYKHAVSSAGIAEYYTDPWWKHCWEGFSCYGPDIVASLTGDRQNRWIADLGRDNTWKDLITPANGKLLFFYYAASAWQDIDPEPVPDNTVLYDKNINGPRGRFSDWLWAANSRYGCDTAAAAMANYYKDDEIVSLLGVSPEIPYRPDGGVDEANDRHALGLIPEEVKTATDIDNLKADFSITYMMSDHRTIWDVEPFPLKWECTQKWVLGESSMTGTIKVTSLEEQMSPLPRIRIRWGTNGEVIDNDNDNFNYGPFTCKVKRCDFTSYKIEKTRVMPCKTNDNAWQIVYTVDGEDRICKAGESFEFDMVVEFEKQ